MGLRDLMVYLEDRREHVKKEEERTAYGSHWRANYSIEIWCELELHDIVRKDVPVVDVGLRRRLCSFSKRLENLLVCFHLSEGLHSL